MKTTEHAEQVIVVEWLRARGCLVFSVPNGAILGGRNKWALLGKLKKEGLLPGAPDLIVASPVAIAIEMKRGPNDKPSDEQLEVHDKMRAAGWPVVVGDSEAVIREVDGILTNKKGGEDGKAR